MRTITNERARTAEQVRQDFAARGESFAEFARKHGLSQSTVNEVLAGRKKGRRGEAHRAAVLLGLKVGTTTPSRSAA